MAICGYEFPDGIICGQVDGHLDDNVPHIRWGEGHEYWNNRRKDTNDQGHGSNLGEG